MPGAYHVLTVSERLRFCAMGTPDELSGGRGRACELWRGLVCGQEIERRQIGPPQWASRAISVVLRDTRIRVTVRLG